MSMYGWLKYRFSTAERARQTVGLTGGLLGLTGALMMFGALLAAYSTSRGH
jgi:hypothetical protein